MALRTSTGAEAALLDRALALYLAPLEPARYAGRIASRPVLMINGTQDGLIPRRSVEVELQWMEGGGLLPAPFIPGRSSSKIGRISP